MSSTNTINNLPSSVVMDSPASPSHPNFSNCICTDIHCDCHIDCKDCRFQRKTEEENIATSSLEVNIGTPETPGIDEVDIGTKNADACNETVLTENDDVVFIRELRRSKRIASIYNDEKNLDDDVACLGEYKRQRTGVSPTPSWERSAKLMLAPDGFLETASKKMTDSEKLDETSASPDAGNYAANVCPETKKEEESSSSNGCPEDEKLRLEKKLVSDCIDSQCYSEYIKYVRKISKT